MVCYSFTVTEVKPRGSHLVKASDKLKLINRYNNDIYQSKLIPLNMILVIGSSMGRRVNLFGLSR